MTPLTIDTLLSVHELGSGHALVYPVADATRASFGAVEQCLFDQRLCLSELFAGAPAAVLARHSLPKGVEPRDVEVVLERHDLPRALRSDRPIVLATIAIPHESGTWVVITGLAHTVFVGHEEKLEEVVRAEAVRFAAALELDPWEMLRLYPARAHRLEPITVEVELPSSQAGSASGIRKRIEEAHARKHAFEVLASSARRLDLEPPAEPEPVGVGAPLSQLDALLGARDRKSLVLVGDELAGKSAVFREWLRQNARAAPRSGAGSAKPSDGEWGPGESHSTGRGGAALSETAEKRFVFATSGAELVAGMSFLGQWQARLRRVLDSVERLDAVLYFEDLRDLFTERGDRGVDLSGAIKSYLDDDRVRVVGEIAPDAYDRLAPRYAGFFAALHPIRVDAGDARGARTALERHRAFAAEREPDRPSLSAAAVGPILELTERYLPYRPFPGKAVRLFEEIRRAAERAHYAERRELGARHVYETFSMQTGIPEFVLRDDVALKVEDATAFFRQRIVGQERAVAGVVETICVVKAGLEPQGKPLAVFLFAGPTGVGKTELARALATFLFRSPERLLRFDMSEFSGPGAAERLIRGTQSDDGLLTRKIREQPFSVVLLDEIEKAHPAVFDLLLQVLGEGRLTDARGRTAYFHNAIVIMTSNLGSRAAPPIGLGADRRDSGERFLKAVHDHFRREFVQRIDRIVPFAALSESEIREVTSMVVARLGDRRGLREQGIAVSVSESARDRLATLGYSAQDGARALRRAFEDSIVAPLARSIGSLGMDAENASAVVATESDELPAGPSVIASERRAGLAVVVLRGEKRSIREDRVAYDEVAKVRRRIRALDALPVAEEARERLGFLLTQLSYGDRKKHEWIESGAEIGRLQQEHHALAEVVARIDRARTDVESIEELVLGAVLSGDSVDNLLELAREAEVRYRAALLELFLLRDPRHEVSLLAQELDAHRTLDHWLGGLLGFASARSWQLLVHVDGDRTPDLPAARRWGPPREPAEIAERLQAGSRDPISVLVRARGPHAGLLLSLEVGLHRYDRGGDFAHFRIRPLTQRFDLTNVELEKGRGIVPEPIPPFRETRLSPVVRKVEAARVVVDDSPIVNVGEHEYWSRFTDIALEHLLLLEAQPIRSPALFAAPLDTQPELP